MSATLAEIASGEVKMIESRADVDSLNSLQRQRRLLVDQIAPLEALYGAFGQWEPRRKQLAEAMKVKVRAESSLPAPEGTTKPKLTDKDVDALAHDHPDYKAFLDRSFDDKVKYLRLANRITEIEEKIKSRDTELYVYGKEITLGGGR